MSKETDKELAERALRHYRQSSPHIKERQHMVLLEELASRMLAATGRVEGLEKLVTTLSTTPPFYVVPGYEDCSGKEILEIIESRGKI